jgi:hypothetical protein
MRHSRILHDDFWSGRAVLLRKGKKIADLLMLTVCHPLHTSVELGDLHKFPQEGVAEAIHVGSETSFTGAMKSHSRQPYQKMAGKGGFGCEIRKISMIALTGLSPSLYRCLIPDGANAKSILTHTRLNPLTADGFLGLQNSCWCRHADLHDGGISE